MVLAKLTESSDLAPACICQLDGEGGQGAMVSVSMSVPGESYSTAPVVIPLTLVNISSFLYFPGMC